MFAALRASCSRSVSVSAVASASAARAFASSTRVAVKQPLRASAETPTPGDLLAKIGRNADKKLADKVSSWEELSQFYFKGSPALEEAGLTIKERRYIMWAFSRYSIGDAPSTFIKAPKPPKKFRGWGPKVQHGVRIR